MTNNKSLFEKWTQKYKKSIDCSNPKGFSQRAHCQGRKKRINEDLRRWFKEKWTAQDGSECGDYKGRGRVKCRPSKRVSDKSPQTWGEMSKEEKKKAVRKKQEAHRKGKQWSSHKTGKTWDGPKNKYKPGKKKMDESYLVEDDVINRGENPNEYRSRLLRTIQSGDISSMDHHDRVHGALAYIDSIRDQYEGSARSIHLVVAARGNKSAGKIGYKVHGIGGSGKELITSPLAMGSSHGKKEETPIKHVYGLQLSSYPNLRAEHREVLRRLMDFKGIREMYETIKQMFIERKLDKKSDCGCDKDLQEEKKPYKGFKKGKNHPEGGLSRAEARRQGIHAGIETKDEAKRKGGFGKLSKKTQKRRKSFCARMCGMKKRRTSSKTARDPKSKINAALRVWGCRCGTNESFEGDTRPMLNESKNSPTDKKLWSKAKALARQKFKVYPSAYANAWAAKWYKKRGGGWRSAKTEEFISTVLKDIVEEVVNKPHKGSMTKKEISERDRLAKKVKGIKAIKGKDSDKNAKYRYATYIILKKRGGGSSKEKSSTTSTRKKSKKKK